jgi:hypothetical protein
VGGKEKRNSHDRTAGTTIHANIGRVSGIGGLQKQNAICKTRAQCAKGNSAFELFKEQCATTINAKNVSLKKKFFKGKE